MRSSTLEGGEGVTGHWARVFAHWQAVQSTLTVLLIMHMACLVNGLKSKDYFDVNTPHEESAVAAEGMLLQQ